jgi:hypothetical protein
MPLGYQNLSGKTLVGGYEPPIGKIIDDAYPEKT